MIEVSNHAERVSADEEKAIRPNGGVDMNNSIIKVKEFLEEVNSIKENGIDALSDIYKKNLEPERLENNMIIHLNPLKPLCCVTDCDNDDETLNELELHEKKEIYDINKKNLLATWEQVIDLLTKQKISDIDKNNLLATWKQLIDLLPDEYNNKLVTLWNKVKENLNLALEEDPPIKGGRKRRKRRKRNNIKRKKISIKRKKLSRKQKK